MLNEREIISARYLFDVANTAFRDDPDISARELLDKLRAALDRLKQEAETATYPPSLGKCRWCGYDVVSRPDGILVHATPEGRIGDRGCRANLFAWDEDRWGENPPELRTRYASLPRREAGVRK